MFVQRRQVGKHGVYEIPHDIFCWPMAVSLKLGAEGCSFGFITEQNQMQNSYFNNIVLIALVERILSE